jgi:hypothetical protein
VVVATVQLSSDDLSVQSRVRTTAPTVETRVRVSASVERGCGKALTVVRHSISRDALRHRWACALNVDAVRQIWLVKPL